MQTNAITVSGNYYTCILLEYTKYCKNIQQGTIKMITENGNIVFDRFQDKSWRNDNTGENIGTCNFSDFKLQI